MLIYMIHSNRILHHTKNKELGQIHSFVLFVFFISLATLGDKYNVALLIKLIDQCLQTRGGTSYSNR